MSWWKSASKGFTLGSFVKVGVGMEDADFWVIRRGGEDEVGKPVKEFGKERIGVKVLRPDVLLPDYARWLVYYRWTQGWFRSRAVGVTRLVNIRARDVEEMPLPVREGDS
jgi:hypothetical protein